MTDDLVKRLRSAELWSRHTRDGICSDGAPYEAADAIERKDAALRVALEGFEIIAGKRQCLDNLMGHADVAEWCIAKIEEALK